jgi:hypothetical protein
MRRYAGSWTNHPAWWERVSGWSALCAELHQNNPERRTPPAVMVRQVQVSICTPDSGARIMMHDRKVTG